MHPPSSRWGYASAFAFLVWGTSVETYPDCINCLVTLIKKSLIHILNKFRVTEKLLHDHKNQSCVSSSRVIMFSSFCNLACKLRPIEKNQTTFILVVALITQWISLDNTSHLSKISWDSAMYNCFGGYGASNLRSVTTLKSTMFDQMISIPNKNTTISCLLSHMMLKKCPMKGMGDRRASKFGVSNNSKFQVLWDIYIQKWRQYWQLVRVQRQNFDSKVN